MKLSPIAREHIITLCYVVGGGTRVVKPVALRSGNSTENIPINCVCVFVVECVPKCTGSGTSGLNPRRNRVSQTTIPISLRRCVFTRLVYICTIHMRQTEVYGAVDLHDGMAGICVEYIYVYC